MWKEAVMPNIKYYTSIYLDSGLRPKHGVSWIQSRVPTTQLWYETFIIMDFSIIDMKVREKFLGFTRLNSFLWHITFIQRTLEIKFRILFSHILLPRGFNILCTILNFHVYCTSIVQL
jgi:hypothetical protein